MSNIGFIGLGSMGAPMATHLLAAGHSLTVFARRQDAAQPLVALGATLCQSPAQVARNSDVIFTIVTDTAAVEAVILGTGGIIEGLRPDAVVIDHSTIKPS